jgi:hypothetical protein
MQAVRNPACHPRTFRRQLRKPNKSWYESSRYSVSITSKIWTNLIVATIFMIPVTATIYLAPIIASPIIVAEQIKAHGFLSILSGNHISEIYTVIFYWCLRACILIYIIVLVLFVSNADAREAETITNLKNTIDHDKEILFVKRWLILYYAWFNSRLLIEYTQFVRLPENIKENYPQFQDYLRFLKSPYLSCYEKPEASNNWRSWAGTQFVTGHYRTGHFRNTKHGQIYIKSHGVRPHTRTK